MGKPFEVCIVPKFLGKESNGGLNLPCDTNDCFYRKHGVEQRAVENCKNSIYKIKSRSVAGENFFNNFLNIGYDCPFVEKVQKDLREELSVKS